MKSLLAKTLFTVTCVLMLTFLTAGQQKPVKREAPGGSMAATLLKGTSKVAAIVVGSASQAAWVTTKFIGKNVAWPAAKTLVLKSPQKAVVLGLKTAGFSLRKGIPMAGKVGLAYLKAKLP